MSIILYKARQAANAELGCTLRNKQIRGLWFHNDAERVKVETMLEQTMDA